MKRRVKKKHRVTASLVATIGAVVMVAVLLVLALLGFRTYVITGGSMTGAIGKGALILDKTVPVSSLQVGDIITFRPPDEPALVTHRIVAIDRQTDGQTVFRTKGDFNEATDPWQFTLDLPVQARFVAQIPYLGYALAALSIPIVHALLLSIPALLIVLSLFFSLWKQVSSGTWQGRRRRLAAESNDIATRDGSEA